MTALLALEGVTAGYGASVVLDGVSLTIGEADALAVLGRNGVGKSTLMLTIMGLTALHRGALRWAGKDLVAVSPFRRTVAGIAWVPQERLVFRSLTVDEHLRSVARPGRWTPAKIYELFPGLGRRRTNYGDQLSGGEQQMLAIARALMTNPELLILDEATEGLAPIIRSEIWKVLRKLKLSGQSILLVDKNVKVLARLADRHYVLERGRVRWSGDSRALGNEYEVIRRFVGL